VRSFLPCCFIYMYSTGWDWFVEHFGTTAGREFLCNLVVAMDCNKSALSCVGTALELYRRIGVPYREVGRGGCIISAL
jgi:hypothetical protein